MGILGQTPLAGVSLQVLQYLDGFRRLGYDCYYIEDTNEWPFNPALTTCVVPINSVILLDRRKGLRILGPFDPLRSVA